VPPAGASRGNLQWRAEFKTIVPDLTEDDICGSGFAITSYSVSDAPSGEAALARFREKLARCGTELMLDFVPDHTAPDHPWVKTHPRLLCARQRGGADGGAAELPAGRDQ
jgi:hypothetical protein